MPESRNAKNVRLIIFADTITINHNLRIDYANPKGRDSKGFTTLWSGQGLTALAGLGAAPRIRQALRKGEFRKQSSELFSEEGRPASEGVPIMGR